MTFYSKRLGTYLRTATAPRDEEKIQEYQTTNAAYQYVGSHIKSGVWYQVSDVPLGEEADCMVFIDWGNFSKEDSTFAYYRTPGNDALSFCIRVLEQYFKTIPQTIYYKEVPNG